MWTDSKTSTAAPYATYQWVDASAGSVITPTTGSTTGLVNIGFNFVFYGNTYSQVDISSRGFLSFQDLLGTDFSANNDLTLAGGPDSVIAPYWDLITTNPVATRIHYQTQGTSPNRQFVVTWSNFLSGGSVITFQAILYETTNLIKFQYQTLGTATGATVSVGVDSSNGTASQYSFNSASLEDGLAILFHTNSSATASATISPSSVRTNTSLNSFTYSIYVNGSTDSLARIDSVLIRNPFTSKSATVTDISVDGSSKFFINSSSRPSALGLSSYDFATWSYNTTNDSISVRTNVFGIRDSIKVTFTVDAENILGNVSFPSSVLAPLVSAARLSVSGSPTVSVIPDTLYTLSVKWYNQEPSGLAVDTTISADDSLRVFAYGYDRNGNFLRRVKVTWSSSGVMGFLAGSTSGSDSVSFHGRRVSSGYISADSAGFHDQTGLITVALGDTSFAVLRSQANNGGLRYDTLSVLT
ncbi:hypothetical protein HUU58_12165, partial [bacterium]|nr:hypothetical protein [bacterium]